MTDFDVLDRAHTALHRTVRALRSPDLARPTPCTAWDVAQVLQHAAGDQRAYSLFITGRDGPTGDPFAPDGALTGAPLELLEPALAAAARAFAGVDPRGTAPTPLPQGTLPAHLAAGAAALDAAIHAWDIAVATDQPSPLDDELAAALLPVAHELVEPLRQWGAYAPALDPVDVDDAAAELLRFLGRDPEWSPLARAAG
ncbi:TIGR03086 family metal-binding protein [Cellulomonas sp. P5_E12]